MANYNSKNKEQSQDQIFEKLKVHILKVIELTKQGYTSEEIEPQIICEEPVQFLIRIAKKNHLWFSEEELKVIKAQRKEKEKLEKAAEQKKQEEEQKKIEKQKRDNERIEARERIYEKLKTHYKSGKTYEEIAKLMNYSISHVVRLRKECIESGMWFSEKELEEVNQKRKSLQKQVKQEKALMRREAQKLLREQQSEELKTYYKIGKTYKEIANEMNCSISYITGLRKECIESGTWFSEKELEEIDKKRKPQKQINQEKLLIRIETKKRIYEELKMHFMTGKTYPEVAKKMNCSISNVIKLHKECIEENNWFSKEEISFFKQQRKIREVNGTEEEFEKLSLEDKIRVLEIAKQEKLKQDAEIKARQEEEKRVKAQQKAEKKAEQEEKKKIKEQQRIEKKVKKEAEIKAKEQRRAERETRQKEKRKPREQLYRRVKNTL